MRFFPHKPTVVEIHSREGTIIEIDQDVGLEPQEGEDYPFLIRRDDVAEGVVRLTPVQKITETPDRWDIEVYNPGADFSLNLVVRPYDEYDPVTAGVTDIPWPKTVMQDWLSGGTVLIEALVDTNGDVATMMMSSASALYLRFSNQWVLLTDPETIEDYDVVGVEGSALDLYDRYDILGQSVKIGSMPVIPADSDRVGGYVEVEGEMPLVAAGVAVPTIASARDLPAAIEFAQEHTDFQWYVDRRAKALKIEDYDPPW
jgi:hypothetical protein